MIITKCKIVVIMLFALFFLLSNCRKLPIEAAQLRKRSLQPVVFDRGDREVSQDTSVLAGYANLEAIDIAKLRGVNDIERRFIQRLGQDNTAGTPEKHLSLKRSLFVVSGTRPSMKMGYQNKYFSGTQEAKSSSRTFGNIPETSKARPIDKVAAMPPPKSQADQDDGNIVIAMDYAPAHKKPPIHN